MNAYKFNVVISSISLGKSFAFKDISPLLRNSSIAQVSNDEICIEITKGRTRPEDVALNEAASEVEELLDRLALIDNHRIVSFQYVGFTDENGTFHKPSRQGGAFATATAGIPDPDKYYGNEQQKKILAGRINPGIARLHRTAQGMPNGIGKFLLLYGAIQVIHGDTQAKVDDYLLIEQPTILMVQGKHRIETIITHIRNEIAHPENNVDVQTLAHHAETYCPMLIDLVRKTLVSQIH